MTAGAGTLAMRIGPARLRFEAAPGHRLSAPVDPTYRGFVERDPAKAVPVEVPVRVGTGITAPSARARTLFQTGDSWRLEADGDRRHLIMQPDGQAEALWALDTDVRYGSFRLGYRAGLHQPTDDSSGWNREHRESRGPDRPRTAPSGHECAGASSTPTLDVAPIGYPLDQLLLIHSLAARGGALVHACGVMTPAGAVVLAGPSGAGKSTVAGLLGAAPDGPRILSDDRILICESPGGFSACGTPWPGEAGMADPGGAPLVGLGFLAKAGHTAVRRLAPRDALPRLLRVTSVPWYEPALREPLLDTLERLLRAVPLFELRFRRTPGEIAPLLADIDRAA